MTPTPVLESKSPITTWKTNRPLIERFRERKRQAAEALLRESTETDQKAVMHAFETVVLPEIGAAVIETYRKRGLAAPMTRSHFTKFLAEHFFGEGWESPSDAELLDFTISGGRSV